MSASTDSKAKRIPSCLLERDDMLNRLEQIEQRVRIAVRRYNKKVDDWKQSRADLDDVNDIAREGLRDLAPLVDLEES